ncbi:hypothetical protein ACOQFL_05855 [Actinopolyspora sp. H202]|uniref:hypothetical protein n=1 Tax=Actinopolyspora sp. H202 TaxID=1500456 RepID=UPI003EE5AC4E
MLALVLLDNYRRLLRENEYAASRDNARLRAERGKRDRHLTRQRWACYEFRGRQR